MQEAYYNNRTSLEDYLPQKQAPMAEYHEQQPTVPIAEYPTLRQYIGFAATLTLAMGESCAITEAIKHNNARSGAIAGIGAVAFAYTFVRTLKELYEPMGTKVKL